MKGVLILEDGKKGKTFRMQRYPLMRCYKFAMLRAAFHFFSDVIRFTMREIIQNCSIANLHYSMERKNPVIKNSNLLQKRLKLSENFNHNVTVCL